jgi:glycopeptide antibiotics resistance protein
MFRELLRPSLIIFSFALPAWLIFRKIISILKKRQHASFPLKQELLYFSFYIYLVCIFMVTVVPVPLTTRDIPENKVINFIPVVHTAKVFFTTLSPEKRFMRSHVIENIVGNVLLFIPLGMFLPFMIRKMNSIGGIALSGFALSYFIESVQLVSRIFGNYRTVDIDDIILNTAGAVIGFIVISKLVDKPK